MADELKDQRVVTMMSPSELETIDDWAFRNRIRSRGEAIRRLCSIGLEFDANSDKIFSEIVKGARRLSQASQGLADVEGEVWQKVYLAGQDISIAGLDSVSEILALFGPLYLQTLPGRASGDVKQILEISSAFRQRFDSLKENRKDLLAAVAETLTILSRARVEPEKSGSKE